MASVSVTLKPIKTKKFNANAFIKAIQPEMVGEGKDHQKLLNQTTATWNGEKPKFQSDVNMNKGGNAVTTTTPGGGGKGVDKWIYLDKGTRVRYATMSSDWQSKTTPGRLSAGRGRGRVLVVNKRRPRPGIKARGWSEEAAKQRTIPFQRRIIKGFERGANNLFG